MKNLQTKKERMMQMNDTRNEDFKADIDPAGTPTHVEAQVASENVDESAGLSSTGNLTPIQRAHARSAEMRAAGIPNKTPAEKFLEDPRPLRAIRRQCYECNGYSTYWATNCENRDCPLWLFRRGTGVIHEGELEIWRKYYTRHMKRVGELKAEPEGFEDFESMD